jgi:hypothetical protein
MTKQTNGQSAQVPASTKQVIGWVCKMNNMTLADYTTRLIDADENLINDVDAFAKPGFDKMLRKADPDYQHFLETALYTQARIHFLRLMEIMEFCKQTD